MLTLLMEIITRLFSKVSLLVLKTQFKYYTVGMFTGMKDPFPISASQKFNPIQQATYIAVMYFFGPIIIITGCFMFFPELVKGNIFSFSNFLIIDLLHVFTGFIISLFLIIHVYFSTISHNKISSRFKKHHYWLSRIIVKFINNTGIPSTKS